MRKTTQKCIERLKSRIERTKKFGDHDKIVYDKELFLWQYILYRTPIFTLRYYRKGGFADGIDCVINDGGYNSAITNECLHALIKEFDLPIRREDGCFWVGDEKLQSAKGHEYIARVRIHRFSSLINSTHILDEVSSVTKSKGKLKYIINGKEIFERIS